MFDLIEFVRDLIGDPNPVDGTCTPNFTDAQVQRALDQHSTDVFQQRLRVADNIQANGTIFWTDFYSEYPYWESGAQFQGATWAHITPDGFTDYLTGEWHFLTSQTLPVWITGRYFDVYGAAVDLVRRWEAKVKLDFDFSSVNSGYTRSQKMRQLRQLAQDLQQRMGMRNVKMRRQDSRPVGRYR